MGATPTTSTGPATRPAVQVVALIVSVAFLVVGIAGFIPGMTAEYSQGTTRNNERSRRTR